MQQIRIGNVKIDNLKPSEALERALEDTGSPCWVVTPNAVMLEACRHDPKTAALLNGASLSLADGVGVTLAARRQGVRLPRVAGIDFGERLIARAAENGMRVFLLGGEDGVAEGAAERLCKRHPGLQICGTYWGFFDRYGEDDRRLIGILRMLRPDILLVCMGFPRQEEWIAEHLDRLSDVRVIAGLGGSVDVWSGRVRRAPRLLSRMGLEWLWRVAREPKKRLSQIPAILRFGLFGGR